MIKVPVSVSASAPAIRLNDVSGTTAVPVTANAVMISGDTPTPYTGDYEVTPTQEEQTLYTRNKTMTANVVVHKIPPQYGLITWNGAILTVS